ncbi:unnamed protein product, partial [Rotaria magnacalcarata]
DRPSTIILAIIQACNDIETSAAIKYAKMFDPDGERTIGVLTKLDLVDRGAEQKLLEVFENKHIPLKHGYLLVKCRVVSHIQHFGYATTSPTGDVASPAEDATYAFGRCDHSPLEL